MSSIISTISSMCTWTEIKEMLFSYPEAAIYDIIVMCQEGMFSKSAVFNGKVEVFCWNELKGRNLVCVIGDR